jgi:Protein of unknown function (DUF3467)
MSEPNGSDTDPEGRYANFFRIGYNAYEFVMDFGQQYPPDPERIHTRIVTSTPLARNLSDTLQRSLEEHDGTFGPARENE